MAGPVAGDAGPGGAGPQVLSVWSAESVKVGDVLDALDGLRGRGASPAIRTAVLTLVIVATDAGEAARARAAVHELGGRHPARVMSLLVDPSDPDAPSALDAELRLLGAEAGGRDVWFEDVELRVRGRVASHLDSLIVPFTLADLPVVAWFVDGLPRESDPLLSAADALLVDARDLDAARLPALVPLTRRHCLVDLSWVRLRPWRILLAGLFDGPDFRPFAGHVGRAEVWGKAGPRHLLGGWLGDRLDLAPEAIALAPAEHVGMRLHARDGAGTEATFEVVRHHARRVEARARVVGGPAAEAVVSLPEATPAWGLAEALSGLGRDPVYVRALRRAFPGR